MYFFNKYKRSITLGLRCSIYKYQSVGTSHATKVCETDRYRDRRAGQILFPDLTALRTTPKLPGWSVSTYFLCIDQFKRFDLGVFCLFDFRPIQHILVMSGQVFLDWTSTNQWLKCLAQGHIVVPSVRLEPASSRIWWHLCLYAKGNVHVGLRQAGWQRDKIAAARDYSHRNSNHPGCPVDRKSQAPLTTWCVLTWGRLYIVQTTVQQRQNFTIQGTDLSKIDGTISGWCLTSGKQN